MKKLAVIALGGNALLRGDQTGTIEEQETNTAETLRNIVFLIKEGYDIVISHGNGPQVGNILMRNDAGEYLYGIAPMPLDVCVADSQGGIGYMVERMLLNIMRKEGLDRNVITMVTQVAVDKDDSAFQNPTKRVGKIYSKEEADKLKERKDWVFKESGKRKDGWRRVVPSPQPKKVLNQEVVEKLAREGNIVIASGGGGIPVYFDEKGDVRPSEAVIDKDLASALLGVEIHADEFYILTDVPYVYKNFNQENQERIDWLDSKDAQHLLDEGAFGEGSMAPKIRACLNFVNGGGSKAAVTEATKLEDTSYGTRITQTYD